MISAYRLNEYLLRINNIMWETWGIKDHPFGKSEGDLIMRVLEEWAGEEDI